MWPGTVIPQPLGKYPDGTPFAPVDGSATGEITTRDQSWFGVLFSEEGHQEFFAHEYGHLLGLHHPWGRRATGKLFEYGDPLCVMSAYTYAGRNPPPTWTAKPDPLMPVHSSYWDAMALSPSGAMLFHQFPRINLPWIRGRTRRAVWRLTVFDSTERR